MSVLEFDCDLCFTCFVANCYPILEKYQIATTHDLKFLVNNAFL